MQREQLEQLLRDFEAGVASVETLLDAFNQESQQERLDNSLTMDLDRQARCGFPEVMYGENKSAESLLAGFETLLAAGQPALATRVDEDKAAHVVAQYPQSIYNPRARTLRIATADDTPQVEGRVTIVTAGTSDLPVAEEALETLTWIGATTDLVQDIGVAGPQRLLDRLEMLRQADVVIVVAGLEGALPSVVGGHLDCPVIGVPTSVGYGASFSGVAALLGMLNSCASNVTVVNIDAGFKAAYVAGSILRCRRREP
jgi:NCAIR mutase (PurE)-related protein